MSITCNPLQFEYFILLAATTRQDPLRNDDNDDDVHFIFAYLSKHLKTWGRTTTVLRCHRVSSNFENRYHRRRRRRRKLCPHGHVPLGELSQLVAALLPIFYKTSGRRFIALPGNVLTRHFLPKCNLSNPCVFGVTKTRHLTRLAELSSRHFALTQARKLSSTS